MPMIVDPEDASAFIQGYTSVMVEIYGPLPSKKKMQLLEVLAAARSKYCADRSLLDPALEALDEKSVVVSPEAIFAIRSLELKHWVYLKDTRSHSIFIDPDAPIAYGVLGLTERIRDLIGGSGAVVQTGLVQYRGQYVSDGIVSSVAWLGTNYKRDFAHAYSQIRAAGDFHKTPGPRQSGPAGGPPSPRSGCR